MIGRQAANAARAVLVAAFNRYGGRAFRVDRRGPNYGPLQDAAALGWCWFPEAERCALTDAGLRELEPYRRDQPPAVVSWVCPVCGHTVGQPAGDTGLPATVRCEHCAATSVKAAEALRERERAS